jgi:predicted type IV restriction endonuclease
MLELCGFCHFDRLELGASLTVHYMKPNITHQLKKYIPHLLKAQEDNLNEADTLQRIIKVFEDVLGYDMLTEISREMQIKCKYVDLTLKIEGTIRFLVEAKSAATVLRDRHIEQGERYAAEGNIPWILLTNGVEWILFHLTFDEGIEYERVFAVNLASDAIEDAAELLSVLHRQSVKEGDHEKFWQQRVAMSASSVAKAIFNEDVLLYIRREIRRRNGVLISVEDLAGGIYSLFTKDAQVQIGPVKVHGRKTGRRSVTKAKESETAPNVVPTVAAAALVPLTQPVIQQGPALGA